MNIKNSLLFLILVSFLSSNISHGGVALLRKQSNLLRWFPPVILAGGIWLAWDGFKTFRKKYSGHKIENPEEDYSTARIVGGLCCALFGAAGIHLAIRDYRLRDKPVVAWDEHFISLEDKSFLTIGPDRSFDWDDVRSCQSVKNFTNGTLSSNSYRFKDANDELLFAIDIHNLKITEEEFEEHLRNKGFQFGIQRSS